MPAGSEPQPLPSLPRTWRPFGVRIAVVGFGVMLLVVCAAAWYGFDDSVRERFTILQRITVLLMGAGLAACGWALARAGRCAEAERSLDRALRLGTKDALLLFHRGYAAGCAGDRAAMRAWYRKALEQSPVFSVHWAPVARRALG